MRFVSTHHRGRAVSALIGVIGIFGLPFANARHVAAAEEVAKQFKVIVTFLGEQPTGAQAAVGITIRGVTQANTVAIDTDGDPTTLNIISQPVYFGADFPEGPTAFGETTGTADLADYTSTASCKAHTETVDPNWNNSTHIGSIPTFNYENYVCEIINTRNPANLTLTQTADELSVVPGGVIHYTLSTTNNGLSSASNVLLEADLATTVTDCKIGAIAVANPAPTLAVGATMTCKASYSVPANVTGEFVANVAKVTSPSDATPPADVTTNVPIAYPVADLTLSQTATETSVFPGDTIHFTISTTNGGSATATNVRLEADLATNLTDCKIGSVAVANPAPTLAVGATLTCKANYVVPANIVDNVVTNVAKVSSPSDITPPANVSTNVAITRGSCRTSNRIPVVSRREPGTSV